MDHEPVIDPSGRPSAEAVGLLERITPLARQINCLDIERIAEICTDSVPGLLGVRFSSVYLLDEEGLILHLLRHNHPFPINRIVSLGQRPASPMVVAVQNRQVVFVEDMDAPKEPLIWRSGRPFAARYHTGSCVIVPLICFEKVVGVWNLADKQGPGFSSADTVLIELFGQLVGASVWNIRLFERLQRQAATDGLTGLANHRTFYQTLERELVRSRRYGGQTAMIMIDVDNLKKINDTHGHRAGDRVIEEVSRRLLQCVRQIDTAARYGGDEFAVILPNTTLKDAVVVADRMVRVVSESPVCWKGELIPLSVSLGVGQYDATHTPEDVISRSDEALYMAKHSGKNTVRVFSESQGR